MDNKLLPVILFLALFIFVIVLLIVLRWRKQNKYKKTIEELDYDKNKIIDIPILSEISKVRELVKTDDLKQKLADWDETIQVIKVEKIDELTDLITEADFLVDRKDYKNALKKIAVIEMNIQNLQMKTNNLLDEIDLTRSCILYMPGFVRVVKYLAALIAPLANTALD